MPSMLRLKLAIAILLLSFSTFANRVVIFGTVKFTNGAVAANYPLTIQPDSTVCPVKNSIATNASGAFESVIECDKAVLKTIISYIDCEGHLVQVVKEVPATLRVEYNIILCAPQNCYAQYSFIYSGTNSLSLQFNSSGSQTSLPSPDEIISRYWSWGDGSPVMGGNIVNPSHVFEKAGSYEICLKIVTRSGCSSYYCKTLLAGSDTATCKAGYISQQAAGNPSLFYFADSSKPARGDSIISRLWVWGDGSSTDGNIVNPTHTFQHDSTYNVCLKITTREGCFSYSCQKITVTSNTPTCKAHYGWRPATNNLSEFHFADSSKPAPGDSIISRLWVWGDGSSTDGNIVNPTHTFLHDSTYNVCLKITTGEGCFSYSCQKITVTSNTPTCKAYYGWRPATNNLSEIHFADSSKPAPGDSIISRWWVWGDGSSTDGNTVNPTHTFLHDSTYNVCLKITTGEGCFSYSCQKVTVAGQNTTCKAYYNWRTATNNHSEFYFTDSSKAAEHDSIISRYWFWGDGSATDGNIVNPTHLFPHDSTYNVCLKITTREGCFSYSCQKVTVGTPPTECKAGYQWLVAASNHSLIYFADTSKIVAGDSIISRVWSWGDGTSADGNTWNPTHLFPHDSTYNVCLKITTREGCVSYSCQKVTVAGQNTTCKANYSWRTATNNHSEFYFTDSSKAAEHDSIISRFWFWGDGSATDGNIVNPTHLFPHDSTYNVCLKITTREGCFSYSCQKVTVAGQNTTCRANYGWLAATNNHTYFYFIDSSKAVAGDSIVSRFWFWGDGSSTDGNIFNPTHTFPHDSTYNVCLKITTREGCFSYSCQKVTVGLSNSHCEAAFRFETISSEGTNPPKTYIKFFSGQSAGSSASDVVIGRRWTFGDGTDLTSNDSNIVHSYLHGGTYTVCLYIKTDKGCYDSLCKEVTVPEPVTDTHCEAAFRFEITSGVATNPPKTYIKFFSGGSVGTSATDVVIGRRWTFGDGTDFTSNDSNIVHSYLHGGTYTVCLYIKTDKGCYDSTCKEVVVAEPATSTMHCEPSFTWHADRLSLFLNSNTAIIAAGDSIIKRVWNFGDGTGLEGNEIDPHHVYLHSGQFEVCLRIITRLGCEQQVCHSITVSDSTKKCQASFGFENIGDEKLRFNSVASYTLNPDDSIIRRYWNFGDGYVLSGNNVAPVHAYTTSGTYTACLVIVTSSGCESRECKQVKVNGTIIADSVDVNLEKCFPNPATNNLYATIWSKHENVSAQLSIYDVYGILKWSKQIILPQGNSTWPVPTNMLLTGPYILKLTTQFGIQHMNFIKMN